MKIRLLRKMRAMSGRIYDWEIRESMGGMGGCVPLNCREQTRLDKLRRFLHLHPKYREYQKIQSGICDRILTDMRDELFCDD